MANALNALEAASHGVSQTREWAQRPSEAEVQQFVAQLQQPSEIGAVQKFVTDAESKLIQTELGIGQKLTQFNAKESVFDLVAAMHESSLRSVSVQLTGKIGTKTAENFEQLVKQQ